MKTFGGKVLFLDRSDINTDEIIPAKYLTEVEKAALAPYLLEDLKLEGFDPAGKGLQEARVIVTRANFGCGSSREHAPIAIKSSGIQAVVARSFARIFYRNAFNTGLPIFESPEASEGIREGDEIEIDADTGTIRNLTKGEEYHAKPIPPFMQDLIRAGGLVEWTRKKIEAA